jgi:hypothetical protein
VEDVRAETAPESTGAPGEEREPRAAVNRAAEPETKLEQAALAKPAAPPLLLPIIMLLAGLGVGIAGALLAGAL